MHLRRVPDNGIVVNLMIAKRAYMAPTHSQK